MGRTGEAARRMVESKQAPLYWVLVSALTAGPASAAFPGSNGAIAFQSDRNGATEVYRMSPDGFGQTLLSNTMGPNSKPAWSKDGEKIAFISSRDGGD
jgi:hypothetical protein